MGILNLGAFAQGAVKGTLEANEEQRRQEDQAFQNEQRTQQRQEWGRQDETRKAIAGIRRPGTYTDRVADPGAMTGSYDEQDAPMVDQTTTVSPEDYARQLASAYKYDPDKAIGALDTAQRFQQTARTVGQQTKADAALERRRQLLDQYQRDPQGFLGNLGNLFNADAIGGPATKGARVAFQAGQDGDTAHIIGPDNRVVRSMPMNGDTIRGLIDQMTDADLSAVSPEMYGAAQERGLKRGELGVKERMAATNEQYRRDQQNRAQITTDGTGRIIALSPDGTRQLGVYGSARPERAAGGGGANKWVPLGADADGTPVFYNAAEFDPKQGTNNFARADGKPVQDVQKLYKKMTGEGGSKPSTLKFTNDGNGGYFASTENGAPLAYPDPQRQFPMIPIGPDPRTDKKLAGRLGNAGAALQVVAGQDGAPMWGYRSKDGRMWSTPDEAISAPATAQPKASAPAGGSSTQAAASSDQQTSTDVLPNGISRSRTQPGAANPYVDSRGRPVPGAAAQSGPNLLTSTVIPAVSSAVDSVGNGLNNAGARYLQGKISRGEALTGAERARATQMGLVK